MTTTRTGQVTDFSSQATEFSVDQATTDTNEWTPEFIKWHGYYRKIPELRAVINKLASWTFGRGIKADPKNESKLRRIKGFGKDSARSVLKNCWRTALICGDSFAHIIRDPSGRIMNLKPLNPQSIKIISNKEGIVVNYVQTESGRKFAHDEIFHLSYERIADEIHGIPFPEALEELIIARNEGLADLRVLYHRNIKPINWIEVETDDQTKINSIQSTIDEAFKKTENIVVPKGVISEIKKMSQPQYGTLDSLNYIKFLVRQFVTACGVPEVIMGWGSDTTEASSKIIYLAFQQEIEDMQTYNEEQISSQLGIVLNLEFPASIEQKMLEDEKKDKGQVNELNVDPLKDG